MTPFLLALLATGSIIIDTDAGSDDMMAIAWLLAHKQIPIEAIVVDNGLAHVEPGARNVLKLCALAGRTDIAVYVGPGKPVSGDRAFPADWRKQSDALGSALPDAKRKPESKSAYDFYRERLAKPSPGLKILALGPLTNFSQSAGLLKNVEEVVIMGGAVTVPGNLDDAGPTDNQWAEWNIWVDAAAAAKVFGSGARIRLVPLDATNKVKIDVAYLEKLRSEAKSPLAKFVASVLESDREHIVAGHFYAWDPLAAVALLHPDVLGKVRNEAISVGPDGRTVGKGTGETAIALDANADKFHDLFRKALMPQKRKTPRTSARGLHE